MEGNINLGHIAEALTVINTPGSQPEQIHTANAYLTHCEEDPNFALALLEMFSSSPNSQLQLSSILLLTNVVKRNWVSRGRSTKANIPRDQIKKGVINACLLHEMKYYKHFNTLIKAISRHTYPVNYTELHQLITSSLAGIAQMNTAQTLLSNSRTMPLLSMAKAVLKEYSSKRISHKEQDFRQYITQIVSKAGELSQGLQKIMGELFGQGRVGETVELMGMIRKADKIMLYGLLSMPSSYQSEEQICNMVGYLVGKVQEYNSTLANSSISQQIRVEVEKYIIGILELLTRVQHIYPFIFTRFLKDYLTIIIKMLLVDCPSHLYTKQKLISAIAIANYKPINTYPYYTKPQDFKASIYHRKSNGIDNSPLQQHCYQIFRQMYSGSNAKDILLTVVSRVMTLEVVSQGQKVDLDELVLQDVEIAIMDQVSEPSAYENCLNLCKIIIKNFKEESIPVVSAMLAQIPSLGSQGQKGQLLMHTLIDILLFLPQNLDETELPLSQVQSIMTLLFQGHNYHLLSRMIRKYFTFLDSRTQRSCLDLLVQIVSSPITDKASAETVYQSALALKNCLSETYDFDGVSQQLLLPCMANILRIVQDRQFIKNPTLLWPIINLIVKLVNCLSVCGSVQATSILIVRQLYALLAADNNEELIACALTELLICIMSIIFKKIKEEYPLEGSQSVLNINRDTLFILEGALIMVRNNLNNRALQNYDNIYRLWLTLLRHYPTLLQQRLNNFDLNNNNHLLVTLFEQGHTQVMEDNTVIFLQIVEQMYLIGLLPLDEHKVSELVSKHINEDDQEHKRTRIVLANVSLYLSFALTNHHIPHLVAIFMKELLALRNSVSPPINHLRCFLYLTINHFILTTSGGEAYQMFTNAFGGNFVDWIEPFLFSMQFVSSKDASKINAAAVLKAINDIGPKIYGQMMLTPRQGQYPMDWLLRVISSKLDPVEDPKRHNFDSMYTTILPNQMAPEFSKCIVRKIRLHVQNTLVAHLLSEDLRGTFRQLFGQMFKQLNWGADDLEERVGIGAASKLSQLLGWQPPRIQ